MEQDSNNQIDGVITVDFKKYSKKRPKQLSIKRRMESFINF